MIAKRKTKTKTKRSREFLKALRLAEKEIWRLKREWIHGSRFMADIYFDQITAANQILGVIRSLK